MKALRTLTIISILVSVIVITWQCSDDTVNNPVAKKNSIDFAPREFVQLWIDEYVKVTPGNGGTPYYEFLQIAQYYYGNCNTGGYDTGSFTTPASRRVVNRDTIETQYYKWQGSANWICEPYWYAATFWIRTDNTQYYTNSQYFFGYDPNCTDPSNQRTSPYYDIKDSQYLPPSTTFHAGCGVTTVDGDLIKNKSKTDKINPSPKLLK